MISLRLLDLQVIVRPLRRDGGCGPVVFAAVEDGGNNCEAGDDCQVHAVLSGISLPWKTVQTIH